MANLTYKASLVNKEEQEIEALTFSMTGDYNQADPVAMTHLRSSAEYGFDVDDNFVYLGASMMPKDTFAGIKLELVSKSQ